MEEESGFSPEEEEARQESIRRWKEWAAHDQSQTFAKEVDNDAKRTLANLFGAAKQSSDAQVRALAFRYEVLLETAKLLKGET